MQWRIMCLVSAIILAAALLALIRATWPKIILLDSRFRRNKDYSDKLRARVKKANNIGTWKQADSWSKSPYKANITPLPNETKNGPTDDVGHDERDNGAAVVQECLPIASTTLEEFTHTYEDDILIVYHHTNSTIPGYSASVRKILHDKILMTMGGEKGPEGYKTRFRFLTPVDPRLLEIKIMESNGIFKDWFKLSPISHIQYSFVNGVLDIEFSTSIDTTLFICIRLGMFEEKLTEAKVTSSTTRNAQFKLKCTEDITDLEIRITNQSGVILNWCFIWAIYDVQYMYTEEGVNINFKSKQNGQPGYKVYLKEDNVANSEIVGTAVRCKSSPYIFKTSFTNPPKEEKAKYRITNCFQDGPDYKYLKRKDGRT